MTRLHTSLNHNRSPLPLLALSGRYPIWPKLPLTIDPRKEGGFEPFVGDELRGVVIGGGE